jgi:O-antigen/teichoic acid export membrane protein
LSLTKYFAGSFAWVIIAKVLDAAVKFLSIPLLISYFGQGDYGILVLGLSTNAYLELLDFGINTGGVKYYTKWIVDKNYALLQSVTRTSISFYLAIGLLNCVALILLAVFGTHFFQVSHLQFDLLRTMFMILSIYSIINWPIAIFSQLLVAAQNIRYIQFVSISKSIMNLLLVLFVITNEISLITYFLLLLSINTLVFIPYFIKCKRSNLIKSIIPGIDWRNFQPLLLYSAAIFAMGFFQFTAAQSRPLILSIFNSTGPVILTEYRIMEVFPLFIISIGGMIITILLPISAGYFQENNTKKIAELAYTGTSYTSIVVSILCFPILINANNILLLYVGKDYLFLGPWLSLWIFTLILYLHNGPVATLVLSSGRTKPLVYSSALACVISMLINAIFCQALGAGSAVLGYFTYIFIQMAFYYLYLNRRLLNLDSMRIFKSFIIPTTLAALAAAPIPLLDNISLLPFQAILIKSFSWCMIYFILLIASNTLNFKRLTIQFREIFF